MFACGQGYLAQLSLLPESVQARDFGRIELILDTTGVRNMELIEVPPGNEKKCDGGSCEGKESLLRYSRGSTKLAQPIGPVTVDMKLPAGWGRKFEETGGRLRVMLLE
jgi:hypothetical protein